MPVRFGSRILPPYSLNFTRATAEEIAATTVEPDPEDGEGALLAEVAPRDTLVCAVLSGTVDPRRRAL